MDEIFNSGLAQSIREKVDSNLRMVDRIGPTSEEPIDALLISMNGVDAKRSRRKRKEDEADDDVVYDEEGKEVDITPHQTCDERTCKLCGTREDRPAEHIACFHLKKNLFTCPACDRYGSLRRGHVTRHIAKMHPLAAEKRPVSHAEELSAEIQRLQVVCFPALKLRALCPNTSRRVTCMICNDEMADSHRQDHIFGKHFKKAGLFGCPLCSISSLTFSAVREHIKWHHQKDYGKMQPISHEKEYEKEISALNEQCFPGWRRQKEKRKKKTPAQKENSAEKCEAEEEDMPSGIESGKETEWKGTPEKSTKGTPALKTSSKRMKTSAEGDEEMDEGQEGASGSGLH